MTLQTTGNGKTLKEPMSEMKLLVLVVGQEADLLERKTAEGFTHRWKVYVRTPGPHQPTDRSFINKVVFNLHPEFKNPDRIIRKPPFEVNESGYGSFSIGITVFFAEEMVKQFHFSYELFLHKEEPTYSCRPQILQITDPKVSKSFMDMIPMYCSGSSPRSKDSHLKEPTRSSGKDREQRPIKKREKKDKETAPSISVTPSSLTATPVSKLSSKCENNKYSEEKEHISKTERNPGGITPGESSPATSVSQLFGEKRTKNYKSPIATASSPARLKKQIDEKQKVKKTKAKREIATAASSCSDQALKTEKKIGRIAENDLFSTALQNAAVQKSGERKRKIDVDQLFSEKRSRQSPSTNGVGSSSSQRLSVPLTNGVCSGGSRPSSRLAEKKIPIPLLHKKHPGKKTPEDTRATSRKQNIPLEESPSSSTSVSSNVSEGGRTSHSTTPSTASTGSQSSPGAFQNCFEIASPFLSSHDDERSIDISIETLSDRISAMSDPTTVSKIAFFLISSDSAHLVKIVNEEQEQRLECDLREVNPSLLPTLYRMCTEQTH